MLKKSHNTIHHCSAHSKSTQN